MKKLLKILHLISLSVFVGSIATYIFLGALVPENNELAMELNRQWVATSTLYLTITSIWVTGLTGILLSGKPNKPWLWAKLTGFIGIGINTHLFIYPAIVESKSFLGINNDAFQSAMQQEAIFGAVNIILILFMVSIAVLKPKFSRNS
jgi:hypothetical protein